MASFGLRRSLLIATSTCAFIAQFALVPLRHGEDFADGVAPMSSSM